MIFGYFLAGIGCRYLVDSKEWKDRLFGAVLVGAGLGIIKLL